MSKSKGNTLDASDLVSEHSADLVRLYLLWKGTPIDSVNFDAKEMYGRPFQVLNTLYHLHLYYQTNSRYDGFVWEPSSLERLRDSERLEPQDRWLLSKLEGLVASADKAYAERRFNEATRAFDSFIIEVLSQEYVPLTRAELWDDLPETKGRRMVIYTVLAHALRTLDLLMHPYIPFLSDFLFNAVFSGEGRSILVEEAPSRDGSLADMDLEEEYDRMWALVSLANSARMNAKVKRRWPLGRGYYSTERRLSAPAERLLSEVANVRTMEFRPAQELPVKLRARLDTSVAGKRLKQAFNSVVAAVNAADPWSLWSEAREKGQVSISVGGREYTFDRKEMEFEVRPQEGYAVGSLGDNFVALDSTRDEELTAKGMIRDVARRLQALRKERGYVPTDILPVAAIRGLDRSTSELLRARKEELLFLVRVKDVDISEGAPEGDGWSESDLDGKKIYIRI